MKDFTAHQYQNVTIEHILQNPFCGVFLDMGLGKTVSTLTALSKLKAQGSIGKVIVVGPKRVIEMTWPKEMRLWNHLRHLSYSVVTGTEKQRRAALRTEADIYLISRDNFAWLVTTLGGFMPFDTAVIDELSSFKNTKSTRYRAALQVRPQFDRVIGLTGTPAPNGLFDLFAEMQLLDLGERLGTSKTKFREKYFDTGARKTADTFDYVIKKGEDWEGEDIYEVAIYDKIKDICISMKAVDHLDLPELIEQKVEIVFSKDPAARYAQFEVESVLEIINDPNFTGKITAASAASLSGKLLQFAGGAVYIDEKKNYTEVHDEKLLACDELVEEAMGKPVMIFYWYGHERDRLMKRYRNQGARVFKTEKDLDDWNDRKIPILLVNPQSAGHGLNFQYGGHIMIWYACIWSLELYQQAIARLFRQGQTDIVRLFRLIAMGTLDEKVVDRLDKKEKGQDALMEAVKAIFDRIKPGVAHVFDDVECDL